MIAEYRNGFQPIDMRQQNRFIMQIDGITSWYVRTTDLPSLENNPVVVDTINAEYKIKGKSRWQDISITLYDPVAAVGKPSSDQLFDWIDIAHHNSAVNRDGMARGYKKDVILKYVTPFGLDDGRQWTLYGAFVASANFGSMDVSSDDLVGVELTLSYDWARLA